MVPTSRPLSLRSRLTVVACLALLLGALPGAALLRGYATQQDTADRQHQALPANRAWQALLAQWQVQRGLAAESLSTRPIHAMAEQTRAEARQATEVGDAVRAIDTMTQQNAALEQAAASADSLRAQAQGMDATVNTFRL